ncbi:cysteine/glutathione ABC transporter permease/ATP-binding protein CydD [Parashewanella curva]|uniref:Cysteine/glutathione ABC transporter permease/ATP-binding protein CydD n=1 Tax=Parashewanella curva TaxID=2338552 RepID=A0A3L8PV11_9GAMM|nr:cysteine/glutathione ABC transporter permease/ATP-binding protein CydD [Parashewanella curva]RLV59241.1 cysteine/glutathione ABC transporter permease/ATP-binding protein CydD [Parashewanella curva]
MYSVYSIVFTFIFMVDNTEKQLLSWLKAQAKSSTFPLSITVLLGALLGVILIAQAYIVATTLEQVIIKQSSADINTALYWLLVLTLLRAMISYGKELYSYQIGQNVRQRLRQGILHKLHQLGPMYAQTKPAGEWSSMLVEQVEQLQEFYSRYLPQMAMVVCIPLMLLVVVFPQSWVAGLILLLTAPLIPLFMILVGMGAAKASQQHTLSLQRLSAYFADRISGLATLKLFYRYQSELSEIKKVSEDYRSRTMSVLKLAFLSSAVLEFFAAVSIALLAVYLGFSFLEYLDIGFYGVKVSLFSALFILLLAPEFYQPLRELGAYYHAKSQAVAASEAIVELVNKPEPDFEMMSELSDEQPLSIEAKDWVVRDHQGKALIGPLNFHWQQGKKVAIVGKSGSGKTVLLNGLLGFYPYQGSLTVNGIELSQLKNASWYQRLAWLPQQPRLPFGTIKESFGLLKPEISKAGIWLQLEKVGLADSVKQYPLQLDLMVTEKNTGLSVGQGQRLAMAILLLQSKPLLIADEPTASLDELNQDKIWSVLLEKSIDSGCIISTHQYSKLNDMDEVWVMKQGKIVEQGAVSVLAKVGSEFMKLGANQK